MRNPATLLTLAALAGCAIHENPAARYSPEELAEFMGTREERAARAPYSPPGWPLKRGDVVSEECRAELRRQFPDYCEGFTRNGFWVGDMAFGSSWGMDRETIPAKRDDPWDYIYKGHFRAYGDCHKPEMLPPHVRDPAESHFVLAGKRTGIDYSEGSAEEIWTEERWLAGYTGEGAGR